MRVVLGAAQEVRNAKIAKRLFSLSILFPLNNQITILVLVTVYTDFMILGISSLNIFLLLISLNFLSKTLVGFFILRRKKKI